MKKALVLLVMVVAFLQFAACAPVSFPNCTAMHQTYKGGVARPGYRQIGGALHYAPYVSTALYDANVKLDRDKDGIACEQ